MKLLLNAGFGHPLGLPMLEELRQRGFSGIRQDMPSEAPSRVPALLAEIVQANLQPILLIKAPSIPFVQVVSTAVRQSGLLAPDKPAPYIELIGEPDWAWEAAGGSGGAIGWGQFVARAYDAIKAIAPHIKVIAGGITTTDRKRLNYLAEAEPHLPTDCIIGYHTYRTTQEPWVPHPGFPDRAAEMTRLREIADGREIFNTEVGWHTAPSRVGGWLCNALGIGCRTVQYNDAQVAEFASWECRFNDDYGSLGLNYFQLNDGADPNQYEQRFGIRYQSGEWKPVAEALRRFVQGA